MFEIFIDWVWCFPQTFCGAILKKITKAKKRGRFHYYNVKCGSVSLGKYIFLCPAHQRNMKIKHHEMGHTQQSRYLGWLYLFVIGIPSIIWSLCFKWYREKYNISYYAFYTEKWANKLVGIEGNDIE